MSGQRSLPQISRARNVPSTSLRVRFITLLLFVLLCGDAGARATVYVVVQLKDGWLIGADSLRSSYSSDTSKNSSVWKVASVGPFVILHFGDTEQKGRDAFDLNLEASKALLGKRDRKERDMEEAYAAVLRVYEEAILFQMDRHIQQKRRGARELLSDERFQEEYRTGFVLLGVIDKKPLIRAMQLGPGPLQGSELSSYRPIVVRRPDDELRNAEIPATPAVFSVPNVLGTSLTTTPSKVTPAEMTAWLDIERSYGNKKSGRLVIDKPYTIGELHQNGLTFTQPGSCSHQNAISPSH